MARIETLLEDIGDIDLRRAIEDEVRELKRHVDFGIVFERHLPETTLLGPGACLQAGERARLRSGDMGEFVIDRVNDQTAVLRRQDNSFIERPIGDVVVVKRFEDPIFPTLRPLGEAGPIGEKREHLVIQGENFHVLEVLNLSHVGGFDCIYIDPPYNTGDKNWKYNNDYVDKKDAYRHSRWLSFMEKRLRLAASLLAPQGVLIVTVDYHEHHRLALLIEQVFRGYDVSTVAIQHNPRGQQGDNFSWTHEYAVFVAPKGTKVIASRRIDEDDIDWSPLRNWGGESERSDAVNCFFPITVDLATSEIIAFGDVAPDDEHPTSDNEEDSADLIAVWPIDPQGVERKWRYARQSIEGIRHLLRARKNRNGRWVLEIGKTEGTLKTVWVGTRYDASTHGSQLLKRLVPASDFDYPKSVYAVADCIEAVLAGRPDGQVLDFFGGSGTTLHATCLLNAADGGARRAVVATNNELKEKTERKLLKDGLMPGDPAYEEHGVFESVTRPRCEAAILGRQATGAPLEGSYIDPPRALADGFDERVAFLALDYLDPDSVEVGAGRQSLAGILWLMSGAKGPYPEGLDLNAEFDVAREQGFAVLTDDAAFEDLFAQIEADPAIEHVFLFTESEDAYQEMTSELLGHTTRMMPRDYLRFFREIAGRRT